MITNKEAERIEKEFTEAFEMETVSRRQAAENLYEAWQDLYSIMERENNYSDTLGSDILDWQIGNWANDVTMALHNAGLCEECIEVNRQILNISWSSGGRLFHENARRDIADEYGDSGNIQKCYQLYEEYLEEDPLWGWGWIGYFRQLHDHDDIRYEQVLDKLYEQVKSGVEFRDKEDLYRELGDEYNTLGDQERADFFYSMEDSEIEQKRTIVYGDDRSETERAIAEITCRSRVFPKEAFRVITQNEEEAKPYLRDAIEKAIQEKMNLDDDYQLHFYALFLLGQFQDTGAFRKIAELVSLPPDIVEYLIGDTITSGLPDILYNTYDGNLEQLKQMIADKKIDEYVRSDALEVMGQLYLDGEIPEVEWKSFLTQKIHGARGYDHIYDTIADLICRCHFVDMLPEIRYMFDHDLMDEGYLGAYDSCVDLMFEYDEENDPLCRKPIDAAEMLKSWAMFDDGNRQNPDMSEKDFEKMFRAMEKSLNPPIQKKKIGRNDPCPCGSGKKYKFCCMNKPKEPIDEIETPEERRRWLKDYPTVSGERKPGRIYLADYYDKESIETDQILYLGMMHRPGLIWKRDERKENKRTKEYLYLAYQKAVEMAARENITSLADFDKKHSIHYRSEEWLGRLLKLLKDAGDHAAYKEVKNWTKAMKG